ncbi:hypothetical protein A7978_04885 (plasmid) [Borrelia turicatae]|uniref:Uncharacterized protein n=2 Tax=Borrelia turicatae TaxID=142 RepID=T1ECR5_BORT9|nr:MULTISPECIES: hypothetical protein [Borrelia]ADN26541.1 hypothetical protein BTA111 [Borrelia turicatae 91E135]ANF34446.1 hypothetical protein A7978_04885 [Borrelia turicatae]UPA12687.1 hypothetical protein bvRMA01_001022 [Borrelia venezuelensis]UPA14035.1 hypothetical protein bt91E135_001201 [Borrelia turicatae 91E135]UPA15526.1 hypothetical protein btBTE5EL_001211 [Borrelia turicatae]
MQTNAFIKTILIIWIGLSLSACTLNPKRNQNDLGLIFKKSISDNSNLTNLNLKKHTKDFKQTTPKHGLFDDLVIFKGDDSKRDDYYFEFYIKEYDVNFDLFMYHKFYRITEYNSIHPGNEQSGKLKKIKLFFPNYAFNNNLKDFSEIEDYKLNSIDLCLSFENPEGKTIDIAFSGIRNDIMAFSKALNKDADKVPQSFSFRLFIDNKSEADTGYYFYKTKMDKHSKEFINDKSTRQHKDEIFKLINKKGINKLKKIVDQFSTSTEMKKFITSKRFNKSKIKTN